MSSAGVSFINCLYLILTMRIILTRHSETEENKAGITQGHLPGKLSELGIEQAKKLALRLKDEKIDVIYSSDLARAADTTKEIVKFHPDVPFHLTNDLRERNMGEFQGRKSSETGFEKAKREGKPFPVPKNGETTEEMCLRAKRLFDNIFHKHMENTVLLVGHGGINLALISAITRKPFMDVVKTCGIENTSVNIFEINKGRSHKIHCLNCTKHLD